MRKRSVVVVDAVHVIIKGLVRLPDTPEVEALRAKAFACVHDAGESRARQSAENDDALMKRVLALHMEMRNLSL